MSGSDDEDGTAGPSTSRGKEKIVTFSLNSILNCACGTRINIPTAVG